MSEMKEVLNILTELQTGMREMQADMRELKTDMQEAKMDIQGLKIDMREIKQESRAQREEINDNFTKIYGAVAQLKDEFSSKTNVLNERVFNVEGKVYRK